MGYKLNNPVKLWCDSKSAISVVQNPGNHKVTKHIETKYLFTRDLVEKKRLSIEYCSSQNMLADLLSHYL